MSSVAQLPIDVPHEALSGEALQGVIEAFVLREGTDYGERVFSFEEKVAQVRSQLECGEARIYFDPETESVQIAIAVRPARVTPNAASRR